MCTVSAALDLFHLAYCRRQVLTSTLLEQFCLAADITYLEAALDSGSSKKASYKILDKSCGAALQGPFRLHRGLAYNVYDQQILASPRHRMMEIVPDCGHNVACVFPSAIGRKALFK